MAKKKIEWSKILLLILLILGIYLLISAQLEEYKLQSDPKLDELKKIVTPLFAPDKKYSGLLETLNNDDLLSKISLYKGNKSYTINKEKIFLCLKDENDKYYDTNFLVYVFLHELTHTFCPEIGHTKLFEDMFEELLDEAVKEGVYDPSKPLISDYCEY
jgi:hypothetical protein